ncbi:MAG: prepilin-type N-terminal cleavage/methylation domain-containing protein [Bacilli bacterium]
MKKKKGFTLVELLAVIVVVLIVVTIVIPLILGIVETARMGAFRDTAYGIAKSGEYLLINERERQTFYYLDYKQYNADNKKLDYRGQSPKTGAVLTEADSKQVALAIHSGTYCATKAADEAKVYVTKTTPEECSSYYLTETKEDTWPEIAEEYDVDPEYLLDLNDETDPTSDPSKKPVKIPIFAISSRRIVSDENKIYYKTFYSVGYTGYLEQFSKTSYEYTIHLGNLPLPLKDIETVRVTEHYTFEKLEEFKTYIVRRNMGDVIWPGEAPKQIDLSKANVFYKHTATSKNMDVDDVVVECDETLCKASIAITVNNLNGVNPNNFEEQLIAYLPVKFTVEFNGESDSCIARTSLDKEAGVLAGTGATDNPYLIESVEDLVALSNNVNNGNTYSGKNISLAITLDLNNSKSYVDATTKKYGDINGNGIIEELKTELTTVEGFKPIGNEIKKFSGKLTGNLNCINNLYIKRPDTSYVGLIGYNNGGTVTAVNFKKLNVTGGDYTAGITGYSYNGIISEININGNVTGANYVGLGAGYLYNYYSTPRFSSLIIEGNVIGNNYVGGLSGYAYSYSMSSGYIGAVYKSGNVISNGTSVSRILGGSGTVSGGSPFRTTTLSKNTITVNGIPVSNTLPTSNHGADFDSLQDLNNINLVEGPLDTYIGGDNDGNGYYWDYDDRGILVQRNTAEYPLTFSLVGSGSKETPYLINNYDDLKQATLKLGLGYKLTSNIELKNKNFYMFGSYTNPFTGMFDGDEHKIYNLNINSPHASYIGFSGYNRGTIQAISFENVNINAANYTGALAGYTINGNINESSVSGDVKGINYVGLAVGYIYNDYSTPRLSSIIVQGNLSGNNYVGGLAGYSYSFTLTSGYISGINKGGSITAIGTNVGRLRGGNGNGGGSSPFLFNGIANKSININGVAVSNTYPTSDHGADYNYESDLNNINLLELALDTYIGGDDDGNGYYWDYDITGKMVRKRVSDYPLTFNLIGTGTPTDPYLIKTPEDLKKATLKLNSNYKLISDINLSGKRFYIIGSYINKFTGMFDGDEHIIYNLNINSPNASYIGFSGYNRGTIQALNLENVNINAANYTGALAGYTINGNINESSVSGDVNGINYVGLAVGYIYNDYSAPRLSSIIVKGNLTGNNYVGGLAGYSYSFALTTGHISGINKGGSITASGTNVGRLRGGNGNGGGASPFLFTGIANKSITINGVAVSNTYPTSDHGADYNYESDLNNINLLELALDTYIGGDDDGNGYYWDYDITGKIVRKRVSDYSLTFNLFGTGTLTNPYLIKTPEDLKQATLKLNSNYKLVSDIDLSGERFYIIGSYVNKFTGIFDGDEYVIYNLNIDSPYASYVGFSGYNLGTIKGLNLQNVNIIANNYVGGISGYNYNSHTLDSIVNGNILGNNYVGLAVGYVYNRFASPTILSIKATGNLLGFNNVGGIVGYAYSFSLNSGHIGGIYTGGMISTTGTNVGRIVGGTGNGGGAKPFTVTGSALSTIPVNGIVVSGTTIGNKNGLDITSADLELDGTYQNVRFNFTDETQEYIWYLDNGVAKFRKGNS